MYNPEKLSTYGTQTEEKQNTRQYVLDTNMHKQPHITLIRHEFSYKQLEVKTNRTTFSCGHRKECLQYKELLDL